MKPFSEMSKEELWRLFPIILRPHDLRWTDYFREEQFLIRRAVGNHNIVRISHIGSTAIPHIEAKPTVDMLLEIIEETDLPEIIRCLQQIGYIFSEQPNNPPPHMMFMKGYTPEGYADKVFHLHVRYSGDWDEVYFRDYLIEYPAEGKKYEDLKKRIQAVCEFDRDAYTRAKTDFIREIVLKARQ